MHTFAFIPRRGAAVVAGIALLLAGAAHADGIYKWVDKDGKTHYSSRPEDAQGAATTTVKPAPSAAAAGAAPPAAASANEEIIRRNVAPIDGRYVPPPPTVQKPARYNFRSEAPEDKCLFARDILAGNARHMSGAPINARDREVAQNDVKVYCKK